ncbi:MAG: Gfo/Idh/MocA family oxidoreductase [Saprospiraceae bacterium]|nr:Gfo/Idh/MocA family oxidoreductase [Saprospiraceae bacterium]
MINIAVVGFGYWGPNLVRNFANTPDCKVRYIVEKDERQYTKIKNLYPGVEAVTNYGQVINDQEVDAIVIATPVYTHFQLASQALSHGKHVLLEKPMTGSVDEALKLISIAEKNDRVLMVDHTYLYTSAVKKIKQLVDDGIIGRIQYIDSTRINLGLFQRDVNVLWDLAPHDISICDYLMDEKPLAVQAVGVSHTENGIENIAYLTLFYPENRIAHFNCSWISPVKIRHMLIGGDEKMIVFNDLETTEKIRIYDKGYKLIPEDDRSDVLIDYRVGDIMIPKIPQTEALSDMAKDFVAAVSKGKKPISDFNSGLFVVSILEAASESIKNDGKKIKLA